MLLGFTFLKQSTECWFEQSTSWRLVSIVFFPLCSTPSQAMVEAERDREMVDMIVKKIEAEERAEQEQYLKSRCGF